MKVHNLSDKVILEEEEIFKYFDWDAVSKTLKK